MSASKKTDPELELQLSSADATNESVGAVMFLRPGNTSDASPKKLKSKIDTVLRRATQKVGEEPQQLTVFANVGSFAVLASPALIRQLLNQPEVASAVANQQPSDMLIQPVSRRPVELGDDK
jgi:hypothetical protein